MSSTSSLYLFSGLSAATLLLAPSFVVAYFTRPRERSKFAAVVTTLGFAVALLCVGCVPIDIYAVSNAEALADEVAAVGASKPASVTNFVRLLYEGLFVTLLVNTFVLAPLAFFYVGEPRHTLSGEPIACTSRLCESFKYTVCFELALAIVLVAALLVKPGTDISKFHDDEADWIKNWALATTTTNVNSTLRFLIACLSTLGSFPWLTFTAFGVARLPASLLRGWDGPQHSDSRLATYAERRGLLGDGKAWLSEDELDSYGENVNPLEVGGRYSRWKRRNAAGDIGSGGLKKRSHSCCRCDLLGNCATWLLLRPVQLALGSVTLALSLLIWLALALALVDTALHSEGPGSGYVLQAPKFNNENALDRALVGACQLRLDSSALTVCLLYFFLASVWGAATVGLRCFCIPCLSSHGQIRPRKTMPQALLLCSVCNAFGTVYFLFQLPIMAPIYATFGCQRDASTLCALGGDDEAECVVSQLKSQTLLTRLGHPFAGFVYFWVNVAFVVAIPVLVAIDLAGLRLSSREAFDIISSDSDSEDDLHAARHGGRPPESDDAIFSRYTRASDWR